MKKRVLILCTGNSARSQMAEGLLRNIAGERYVIFSAGTHPKGVHPKSAEVMQELGIDISSQTSKDVSVYTGQKFDFVITVCDRAKEAWMWISLALALTQQSVFTLSVYLHAMTFMFGRYGTANSSLRAGEPGRSWRRMRSMTRRWANSFVICACLAAPGAPWLTSAPSHAPGIV